MTISLVFLDRGTFPDYIDFPSPACPHRWRNHEYTEPRQVANRIEKADIVIVNKVPLRADVLAHAKIKLIALTATGSNNIDLDYCNANNIAVANIRDYGSESVVEHTLALIFSLKRHLFSYKKRVAAGEWQKNHQFVFFDAPIEELHGSTLGIVGKGTLGTRLAASAQTLGMKVLFAERKEKTTCRPTHHPWTHVLAVSDILSLHCPLTADNHWIMGEAEFAMMKKSSLFINTARGALVDEKALAAALMNQEIAGAGLDVLSVEPPDADNPLLPLAARPNVLITPHTAWTSTRAMTAAARQTMENINAFLTGTPLRLVRNIEGVCP